MNRLLETNIITNNYKARIKRVNLNQEYQFNKNKNPYNLIINDHQSKINQKHKQDKHHHKIIESNQPKYHFNYGQPLNKQVYTQQKNLLQPQSNNQKHKNTLDNNFTLYHNTMKQENSIQKSRDKSIRRTNIWGQNKKDSQKKKKLKIFPQKYQIQVQNSNKNTENKEIQFLKNQILKLKQQLTNYEKNRSIQSNLTKIQNQQSNSKELSLSEIDKLELLRTKRLNELQNYNQTLYNQLAWKLKEIATDEYQFYLEKSIQNKNFLHELYQNSSAKKTYFSEKNTHNNNDQFIDINDFEELYEQSFKVKQKQSHKSFEKSPKQSKRQKTILHTNVQENIYSPFSLNQKIQQHVKLIQNEQNLNKRPVSNQNSHIPQSYTFHKEKHFNKKSSPYMKHSKTPTMIVVEKGLQKKIINNNNKQNPTIKYERQSNQVPNKQHSKHSHQNIQIYDLNRQLQKKINRKRIQSEFIYGKNHIWQK